MKTQKGFILMCVLMMMQILIIFGLAGLQMAVLEFKRSTAFWEQHQLEYMIDKLLTRIETNIASCLIPITYTEDLMSKLKSVEACKGSYQSMEYNYVIESLGEDGCAVIPISAKKLIANYFRVSLWGRLGKRQMLVQSTYALGVESEKSCHNHCHFIDPGRQSWREISDRIEKY